MLAPKALSPEDFETKAQESLERVRAHEIKLYTFTDGFPREIQIINLDGSSERFIEA